MKTNKIAWGASISLAAVAASLPGTAWAQNDQQSEQASSGLGEIVVTARRTEESLQSVPIAVSALSGDFLDDQNIVDAAAVSKFTPNVVIHLQPSSLSAASVYIRGIGNNNPAPSFDQAVGMYMDGVYIARAAGALFDLVDLERVEVLRGPQGTLFGRNTVGGAVQLVTRKPTDEMHAEAKAGYGRYNDWYVKARLDTGYIGGSNIKASITGLHRERDGWTDNLNEPDSNDPGALKGDALMIGLEGDFGALTANYTFDYSKRKGQPAFFQLTNASATNTAYFGNSAALGGDPLLVSPDRLKQVYGNGYIDPYGNPINGSVAESKGHVLTLAYEASDAITLKSISAYREFTQSNSLELDGQGNQLGVVVDFTSPTLTSIQPVSMFNGTNVKQDQWQFSQELQLLGSSGNVSYVLGGYYFKEKAAENLSQLITIPLPPAYLTGFGLDQDTVDTLIAANPGLDLVGFNLMPPRWARTKSESTALFGQLSWKVTDQIELTGGLRYTHDKKGLIQGTAANARGTVSSNNLSWLVSASYHVNDDVMVYARATSGYRSGGFSAGTGAVTPPFKPEKATAYELGFKGDLLDNRLRLNIAAWYTDYSDMQIPQFNPSTGGVGTIVVNAGKATLKGIEVELMAVPLDGLTLDGSFGYTDPSYKEYDYFDPVTQTTINVADEVRFPQSPKYSLHLGGQYEAPIGDMTLTTRLDYSLRGTVFYYPLDRTAPYNYDVRSRPDKDLSGRIALSDIQVGGGSLEIGIWGRNLTNQENIDFPIDFGSLGFAGATFKQPRTYGVDAKISF